MNQDRRGPARLLDKLVSPVIGAVDPDAVLARVDINELIDRLDVDGLLDRIDVDRLMARIDLDRLLARADIDALVQRIDVDHLVGRVDVDGIIRRIDVDAIIRRIDVNGIIQRVDVPSIVSQVRVSQVIGESASHIGEESLAMARRTVGRLDAALLQPVDRAAGRTSEEDRAARAGLAGPLSRLGAWFLDTVVISATFSAIVFVASYLVSLFSTREVDPTHASGPWWVVAATGWAGLYLFVGWFLTQRTVGMAIVGLRIARGDGSTMRARDAFVRVIVFPLSFLLFGLGFVGVVFGRRRRALHDVAARTIVVTDTQLTGPTASSPTPVAVPAPHTPPIP